MNEARFIEAGHVLEYDDKGYAVFSIRSLFGGKATALQVVEVRNLRSTPDLSTDWTIYDDTPVEYLIFPANAQLRFG